MSGKIKHGFANKKEYKTWTKIKQRCHNPNCDSFSRYGGAGIYVCKRWRSSFINFLNDMGEAPTPKHTIERKNSKKGYSPSNCYWATYTQQNRNLNRNVYVTINGEKKCISEWCAIRKINRGSVQSRINKGMNPKEAIMKPFDMRFSNWHKKYSYNGKTKTLSEWAVIYNISRNTISCRIKRGWPLDKVFNTPIISHGHTLNNFKAAKK